MFDQRGRGCAKTKSERTLDPSCPPKQEGFLVRGDPGLVTNHLYIEGPTSTYHPCGCEVPL